MGRSPGTRRRSPSRRSRVRDASRAVSSSKRRSHRSRPAAPLGVLVSANAARTASAIFTASARAWMCRYITAGDSPCRWLCSAVCSTPMDCSLLMTGATSLSSSTRSPMAMASPPPAAVALNATHEPSASAGFTSTSATATCRSARGKLYFCTSPGCIEPGRPMARSTARQSCFGDCAEAGAAAAETRKPRRTARWIATNEACTGTSSSLEACRPGLSRRAARLRSARTRPSRPGRWRRPGRRAARAPYSRAGRRWWPRERWPRFG